MRFSAFLLCALLLQGCGTLKFTPQEYPLRDGLIPPFPVSGPTTIVNAQPDTDQTIVSSGAGIKLGSDLHTITEVMVQQAQKELAKNGQINAAGASKTIDLKVDSLNSDYIAWFFKSKIHYEAKLGDGTVVDKTVPHSSGSLAQDLDGCIAEGVMALFNDDQVQHYLAK
jgi:hypothetical protein